MKTGIVMRVSNTLLLPTGRVYADTPSVSNKLIYNVTRPSVNSPHFKKSAKKTMISCFEVTWSYFYSRKYCVSVNDFRFVNAVNLHISHVNNCNVGPASCTHCCVLDNNNNNNNNDNVYGAVLMTKVIARVHSVYLMNADWAPGGRQPSDQANRLGLGVRR